MFARQKGCVRTGRAAQRCPGTVLLLLTLTCMDCRTDGARGGSRDRLAENLQLFNVLAHRVCAGRLCKPRAPHMLKITGPGYVHDATSLCGRLRAYPAFFAEPRTDPPNRHIELAPRSTRTEVATVAHERVVILPPVYNAPGGVMVCHEGDVCAGGNGGCILIELNKVTVTRWCLTPDIASLHGLSKRPKMKGQDNGRLPRAPRSPTRSALCRRDTLAVHRRGILGAAQQMDRRSAHGRG